MEKIALEQDYYLVNINALLEFVAQRYQFLLSKQEQTFYSTYSNLSMDAKRLYTRCIMRKGEYFRLDKFNYLEILNINSAKDELIECNLMTQPKLDLTSEMIGLFTKNELVEAFYYSDWKSMKRGELEASIKQLINESYDNDENFVIPEALMSKPVVKISMTNFDTFRLLFFGNLRQDLTEFVLQDLGLVNYPDYMISQTNLPIQSRQEIEELTQLHQLSDAIHDLKKPSLEVLNNLKRLLPANPEKSALIRRRHDRLGNALARLFERLNDYSSAAELYKKSKRVPAKERYIRCLDYLGQSEKAWDELIELKKNTCSASEQQFINVFGKKLAKKLSHEFEASYLNCKKEQVIELKSRYPYVEQDVIDFFISQGKAAFWVENSLINSLFALLYWDVLFADISGAFHNPFQTGPNDLYEAEFLSRRRMLRMRIENSTQTEDAFWSYLRQAKSKYHGKACHFSNWTCLKLTLFDASEAHLTSPSVAVGKLSARARHNEGHTFEQLRTESLFLIKHAKSPLFELAHNFIPAQHLRAMFQHILKDLKENRAGMPDLIVFDESGYELIEVKGPGDRLQNNQKAWMNFYYQNNIPHRVIRVRYNSRSDKKNKNVKTSS